MDAVGAGAGVVAFITLALQSAKIICNTLSGIKDGPKDVARAASAVEMLQGALLALSHSLSPSLTRGFAGQTLEGFTKRCSENLQAFASKLAKIQFADTDSRSRKRWKRVKALINEKDLQKITSSVATYSSTLELWLQSIHSTTIHDCKELSQTILATAQATQESLNAQLRRTATELKNSAAGSEASQNSIDNKLSLILEAIQSLKNTALVNSADDDKDQPREHKSGNSPIEPRVHGQGQETSRITECISRLQSLVDQEARVTINEEVDAIIDDLQTIIGSVQILASQDSSTRRNFKRIQGLLSSAQMLSLNQGGPPPITRPLGEILQLHRGRKVYEVEGGKLLVLNRLRRTRQKQNSYDDEVYMGWITFIPDRRIGANMFTAAIVQQVLLTGTFNLIPILQINPILPRDSLVFEHIRQGRTDEFLEMINHGKASLRDHDEWGNSLLADPNPSHHECLKLILEAGADPTVDYGVELSSAFSWAFSRTYGADTETMRIFLAQTKEYGLTIHSRNWIGQTPLLIACENRTYAESENVLPFLVGQGANVTDVDHKGRCCLHFCVQDWPPSFNSCPYIPTNMVDLAHRGVKALIFLISKGADVYAKDNGGRSVSHMVYVQTCFGTRGSCRRDLWDFALAVCGYDVFKVRGRFPRRAAYLTGNLEPWQNYTKGDFRNLWAGREHLCPYPDELLDERLHEPNKTDVNDTLLDSSQSCPRCNSLWQPTPGSQCTFCGRSYGCLDPNCDYCFSVSDSDLDLDDDLLSGCRIEECDDEEEPERPKTSTFEPHPVHWPEPMDLESTSLDDKS
ncbi:hypothetical protein QBC43DRAFT_288937 [Cladorrhinum sp. PSN259]|nr:hypothetical protein QBC43DRAFT_288937 [Cladorrhinum sp. PSN259]